MSATSSNESIILKALVGTIGSLRALELSRKCSLEKHVVNKVLYGLLKRGQVCLMQEGKPRWTATVASMANSEYSQEESKLMKIMQSCGECGASTFSIALKLQKSTKLVNQMLYCLLQDGKVEKINESPPAWRIASNNKDQSNSEGDNSRKRSITDEQHNNSSGSDHNAENNTEEAASRAKRPRCDSEERPASTITTTTNIIVVATPHQPTPSNQEKTWANQCAKLVWNKYKAIHSTANDRDIVAGFLLKEPGETLPRIVALGSGTSIASGDNCSLMGNVVHDSHAEIVARRSLLRWLYSQLNNASMDTESMAICHTNDSSSTMQKPFTLKPFELWLYISQAPCGDGAVYSRSDNAMRDQTSSLCHTNAGRLRVKTEAGVGTSFRDRETLHGMSFDGLQRGDRAFCQSCSDKIAKWNVIGVQDAVLSRLMEPLYLSGIIVGDLYHHNHLARALCCRNEKALGENESRVSLLLPFQPHHPKILEAPKDTPRHEKIKSRGHSINWIVSDNCKEILDCKTGLVAQTKTPSRICKHALFAFFCRLVPQAKNSAYHDNKQMASNYQDAKRNWLGAMNRSNMGHWTAEVDQFRSRDSPSLDDGQLM